MKQCKAITQHGHRCKNMAIPGSDYCHHHNPKGSNLIPALAIGGAIIGNIISPGIGGAIVGGIIGIIIGKSSDKKESDDA